MRASRLLHILLLLQNRGRMTAKMLATELEVAQRTILRDVDALTEAGLPIVVIKGNQGGIELGFNYRTRLTGLAEDEAEALTVLLSQSRQILDCLDMRAAGDRAIAKLVESFPDRVRETVAHTRVRFAFNDLWADEPDVRIAAMAKAVKEQCIVVLRSTEAQRQIIHPMMLCHGPAGWSVVDGKVGGATTALRDWGDINISARHFTS